jgi:hypothetical protein
MLVKLFDAYLKSDPFMENDLEVVRTKVMIYQKEKGNLIAYQKDLSMLFHV